MPSVAPVRLTYNPKILSFDPKDVEFKRGDALIEKTERGLEHGVAEELLALVVRQVPVLVRVRPMRQRTQKQRLVDVRSADLREQGGEITDGPLRSLRRGSPFRRSHVDRVSQAW